MIDKLEKTKKSSKIDILDFLKRHNYEQYFSVTFLHLLQTTFYFSVAIMTAKNMIAKKEIVLKCQKFWCISKIMPHTGDFLSFVFMKKIKKDLQRGPIKLQNDNLNTFIIRHCTKDI